MTATAPYTVSLFSGIEVCDMSVLNFTELPTIACSAPGKVLLAGGYLVLDRAYTGLVFALDARIHVLVQSLPESESLKFKDIIVKCPQFQDAEWHYQYNELPGQGVEVYQVKGRDSASESENRFVETSLTYALSYASSLFGAAIRPATFTILADTEYYSKGQRSKSSWQSSRFHNYDIPIHEVHKTGLGSSAALVTAFVTAAIAYFVPLTLQDAETKEGKQRIHNLAQAAHCAAQGKVGSGFDIAAAVYGSCVYRRFSPKILEKLGSSNEPDFAPKLKSVVDDADLFGKWDTNVDKNAAIIPKGMLLVMVDVDCGSQTVGMVKSVLRWKEQARDEATMLWASLQAANEDFAEQLRLLSQKPRFPTDDLDRLKKTILTVRSLLRAMSREAGVPIEPPVQTALIDACSGLPGVVGGVVPGAGGYDAIALLIEDKADVVRDLRSLLAEYAADAKEADGVRIGKLRLLGVQQDSDGVFIEDVDEYEPWLRR